MEMPALEIRSAVSDLSVRGRKLAGYAAVFDERAVVGGQPETIRAGAFARSLSEGGDVLALSDHDSSKVLARTANGSLRLSEDQRGLAFELDVPRTSIGGDVLEMVETGLAGGMSFAFAARQERMESGVRELIDLDLFEVSVIGAHPAYKGTLVEARKQSGGVPTLVHTTPLWRWRR